MNYYGNMKVIPLTQGKFALVDDMDYERVNAVKWSYDAHNIAAVRTPAKKTLLMHRFIMHTPKGMDTDHINGNRLDNRRSNLRVCTHAENQRNMKLRKNNKSGFKGVSWDVRSSKWTARIRTSSKYAFLGYFDDRLMAAQAYNEAAEVHHGEFARLNIGVQ